ncbi:hypothetical protein PAMP_019137 [Pampus punctatissimus]
MVAPWECGLRQRDQCSERSHASPEKRKKTVVLVTRVDCGVTVWRIPGTTAITAEVIRGRNRRCRRERERERCTERSSALRKFKYIAERQKRNCNIDLISSVLSLVSILSIYRSIRSPLTDGRLEIQEMAVDPIEIHKRKLILWFSHLPQEERQFGGYFSPETMHVDPLIMETKPEEIARPLSSLKTQTSSSPSVTVEELFDRTDAWSEGRGLNVLLYGAVGTGKSTVVRKLVLDWVASLGDLVSRKYLHLRKHPLLSGEGNQAKDVLFLFNGMEKMKLDFRIGSTELCSDPNETLPAGVVVVNLLRKYLLPEANILVTTRLSALDRIPQKYVSRYAQICGFSDPDRQRAYFTSRLLQQSGETAQNHDAQALIKLLYLNLQRESQLAAACFLPSYCWLTCATLHFLHFTDAKAPIRTLSGIYTSFLRLNFGGEVLGTGAGTSVPIQEPHSSLMLYVVRTVGKLAFDGVTYKRLSFSEKELEQWIGGKTKTDEELHQLAMFRTDVLDFFLAPCVESGNRLPVELSENNERRYVFAVPAMQEYLAALYVVLGENKSPLEKLTRKVSVAIGQANEDVSAIINILSKFIPLRVFAVFNLLKLFPKLFMKISSKSKGSIARTMAAEMFRTEDSYNEDVLDQVGQSLLGVHGPQPQQYSEGRSFELYPIFMGGLLHYGNRVLLQQLGCSIQSTTVAQITRVLRKYLVRERRYRAAGENKPPTRPSVEPADICLMMPVSVGMPKLFNSRRRDREYFSMFGSLTVSISAPGTDWMTVRQDPGMETVVPLGPNSFKESGACTLLEALPENQSLRHLSLMHTGMGDKGALQLAERLQQHTGLQELNVAYNNIGDNAALALVDACREHPSIHTVHLYLNPLSDVGKQSLYVRGVNKSHSGSGRQIKVLASVTEGSNISEDWHPILSVIRKNASSWDRERVKQQLKVFLRDLEFGRQQQPSLLKRLHFRRVEKGVRHTLQMLEKDTLPPSTGHHK